VKEAGAATTVNAMSAVLNFIKEISLEHEDAILLREENEFMAAGRPLNEREKALLRAGATRRR
jgi:hypothetical protein